MSDNITVLAGLQYNQGDIIRQTIANTYIVDYGIVDTVNADNTIDVIHAVMGQYIDGTPVGQTVSRSIEVVQLGGANFSLLWPVKMGDGVLLVGLKNAVQSTANIKPPTAPPGSFPHYTRDTLKAIPLQNVANAAFQINVDASGLAQIKNATKSLYTILNNIITHLETFAGGNVVSLGAPLATSAAAITNLTADALDLASLLKA